MVWKTLEAKLSTPRMARYLCSQQGNQQAAVEAYIHNMRIAESLVSIFHVLEVCMRNAIQKEMVIEFGRTDWYEAFEQTDNPGLLESYRKISAARSALRSRDSRQTPDDITAELSVGFWTSLFNRKTFPFVSKPLMRVFHHCPRNTKRADVIRGRLNRARDLRNRCFHHEPLLWEPLRETHRDIAELINWIDPTLCSWLKRHDRLPYTLEKWIEWKSQSASANMLPPGSDSAGDSIGFIPPE
jgi:hypothetical protein